MLKIKIENGIAKICTPYNPEFVKRIKMIGNARWLGPEKCWCVPEDAVEAVRELMEDIYGCSDISENKTVTLRLEFESEYSILKGDVCFFGKVLAHAYGRDTGAKVGDDVSFVKGEATSGGSSKNWESIVKEGSIVVLTNVNENIYKKYKSVSGVKVSLVEKDSINRKKLQEEKERLLQRIAEIDKVLAED